MRLMAWGRADGLLGVAPPRSGKRDQEIERARNWAARTASRWYATRRPNPCASLAFSGYLVSPVEYRYHLS